jgi:hypothetical protein
MTDDFYVEFVQGVLEDSKEEALSELRTQYGKTDDEIEQDPTHSITLEARTLDKALVRAGIQSSVLTRMCIEIIYRAAKFDLWRFSDTGEQFASLRDWAYNRLRPYMENEEYIGRFVLSAERMLLPIDNMHVVDRTTGEVVTGLEVIRNARIEDLRRMSYAFSQAQDSEKQELAQMLYDNAPAKEMHQLRKKIFDAPAATKTNPAATPINSTKIPLLLEMADGGWNVSFPRTLTETEVNILQMLLGNKIEVQWVREAESVV